VIDELIGRMAALLEPLPPLVTSDGTFHATYQRTTIAVAEEIRRGGFADHRAIDGVLASRVGAEDDELARLSGPPPLLDRLLKPLNRLGTQRFLREARAKVWANAIALNQARSQGPGAYAARLAELEELSAAKVTALQAPGQVLLKLAATGFGVRLPG
jgi:uncharacterized protein DUF5995